MTGLFITFEGGDGSGKSTQIARVAEVLRSRGYGVVVSREPGGTELGAQIRNLLLHGGDMGARAEALLYAADRAHHVETVIRPGLASGQLVLVDRYIDSSVAYQGAGRELGVNEIRALSMWATNNCVPDMTLLFDVSVEVSQARVGSDTDRLEAAGRQFHENVRKGFLEMAKAEPERFRVLNTEQHIDVVTASAVREVEDLIARSPAGTLTDRAGV